MSPSLSSGSGLIFLGLALSDSGMMKWFWQRVHLADFPLLKSLKAQMFLHQGQLNVIVFGSLIKCQLSSD
jgi:hypothetical protein